MGSPCGLPRRGSDGAGSLADPQGQAHGAGLAGRLMLATSGHGGGLQAGTGGVGVGHQHVAGLLEELLLGHGLVPLVDFYSMAASSAPCKPQCASGTSGTGRGHTGPGCALYYGHKRRRGGVALRTKKIDTEPANFF